ncbi:PIN domain-containing protein [Halobaculum sp. D14]|uniref:PIN domain-containing protein n=1 Tax=unclassified Halobaculum TaxID=2640896 RepID=UPI003EC0B99A
MTTTALLDANALMLPVEGGVRVFDELDRLLTVYEPVTAQAVVDELEKLAAESGGEEATAASVGRDLADRCRVVEAEAEYADDAVVELASGDFDGYVVTNDKPLRDRLLARNVRVIGLRGANTLAVTEP